MPAIYTTSTVPTTGASLKAQSPDSQRQLWEKGAYLGAQNKDFWKQFEGGEDAVIETKTDFAANAGMIMNFDAMQAFYHKPHFGDQLFETALHYEPIRLSNSKLRVDYIRNGVLWNERAGDYMGIQSDLKKFVNVGLGEWLGRWRSKMMFMSFLHEGQEANNSYLNSRAGKDGLLPTDTLNWDSIVSLGTAMESVGGEPAEIKIDTQGNTINGKLIVATNLALSSLRVDPTYKGYLTNAEARGQNNPLFKGGWTLINGNMIKEYIPVDHDSYGPVGSPLAPKGFLGAAVTSGSTTLTGGGSAAAAADTMVDYWEDFPNYPFMWGPDTYLAAGSTPFYVLVINPPDGTAGANKFNMYEITTNDGRLMTITDRFAVGSGTVGGGGWADLGTANQARLTTDHPIGARVILCNRLMTPIGATLFLCKKAARRGYGRYRNARGYDEKEDGFLKEVYIKEVFGQAPVRDAAGRAPNYSVAWHALNIPGVAVPVIPD